ncbi:ABC transporter permease [Xanthovirga aplysinae]|uniref:ABC transporter permease n=1 Tax=Xanthovirga aplysinae TaxID=2529853 RepID=UPI0012BD6C06|nr:ABC transporter permease [Xanthovirga aplysinae]MTI32853.1 FtsX-like permease family protein [Xanthovirga aplysinae]
MLFNYFKIAYRNLLKHKFYTFINVLGLAVGMACCLLIFFWVQDELSYDLHNEKIERLYRVNTSDYDDGGRSVIPITPGLMAETLKRDFPEVEEAVSFRDYGSALLTFENNTYKIENVHFADSTLFDVFSFQLLEGDPKTALAEPNHIILNESTARRIFGKESALGKIITLEQEYTYKVSGVYKDIPSNAHFHFNMIAAMSGFRENASKSWFGSWFNLNFSTYVALKEGADPQALEAKFPDLIRRYMGPQFESYYGESIETAFESGKERQYLLQPVKDIHLHSNLPFEMEPNGSAAYVYVFSAIALIILFIASINYMNLATARSAKRAREVGVRKVMGAFRAQLVKQFLSESILLCLVAVLLAIFMVELTIPAFNQLAAKSISSYYFWNWQLLSFLAFIILIVGLVSGSYPAFFLSAFQPTNVLKGGVSTGTKGLKLRSALVVLQFGISIFLIVGTVVIYKQLHYINHTDPGFNKEQVLILQDAYALDKKVESFKQEMLRKTNFKAATISGFLPVRPSSRNTSNYWVGAKTTNDDIYPQTWYVDNDYAKTLGLQMAKGRFFSPDFPSDSSAIVINEAAVKRLGLEGAVGKTLNGGTYKIIGVVKNFNFESLKDEIAPLVFRLGRNTGLISFRIEGKHTSEAIASLKEEWNKMAPGQPFSYSFLDERFTQMYEQEQRRGQIFAIFAGLAIFIACLGLFALAAFTAEQRKKEIGVRKVLGSTVSNIVLLLSREFAKLLGIAFILACPIAWWVMNNWLEGFAHRTSIGAGVFLVAGLISFLVAWITMSFHAIKAAVDDPVKAIKYE